MERRNTVAEDERKSGGRGVWDRKQCPGVRLKAAMVIDDDFSSNGLN